MKTLTLAALICATVAGCHWDPEPEAPVDPSNTTYVVTVGMENSRFAGQCPGAGIDCTRMTDLLSKYTSNIVTFQSEKANKVAVVNAMKTAVEKAELFIFYYSGHGGSEWFYDTGAEEVDGKDEFLCLNDTMMRDNEIWDIISKAKGRVVLMFDCCHSRTMFRCPVFNLNKCIPLGATHNEEGSLRMCCMSGCQDDTYSYGSSSGGMFTNTFRKYYNAGLSYDQIWEKVEADKSLQSAELVQRTLMGGFDTLRPIFK